jgi:hypothetical protein
LTAKTIYILLILGVNDLKFATTIVISAVFKKVVIRFLGIPKVSVYTLLTLLSCIVMRDQRPDVICWEASPMLDMQEPALLGGKSLLRIPMVGLVIKWTNKARTGVVDMGSFQRVIRWLILRNGPRIVV